MNLPRSSGFYRAHGKRCLDLSIAILALIALAPVIAVVAGSIRLQMGPPVLFRQIRPGRDGRPFRLFKFRTMNDARAPSGELLPDGKRLTRLGRLLRRLSLDELPQLINVIRGEMSLVGPRPLLMQYLERYTAEQARRHEVPAGVTGWAQVNGRNTPSWEQRLALDVWYVDHQSLGLDFRILLLTVWRVLASAGINQPGHATVERFRGSVG